MSAMMANDPPVTRDGAAALRQWLGEAVDAAALCVAAYDARSIENEVIGDGSVSIVELTRRDGVPFVLQATTPDRVFIVIRGTRAGESTDWKANLAFELTADARLAGRVHAGFLKLVDQSGFARTLETVVDMARRDGKRLVLAGHSLGGALATLAASLVDFELRPDRMMTFGQPQVGDRDFAESFPHDLLDRFVLGRDLVTQLPLPPFPFSFLTPSYRHVGRVRHLPGDGSIREREPPGLLLDVVRALATSSASDDPFRRLFSESLHDHSMLGYLEALKAVGFGGRASGRASDRSDRLRVPERDSKSEPRA
jgi:pimeloyl-ACP methyl ester carboxylesterase